MQPSRRAVLSSLAAATAGIVGCSGSGATTRSTTRPERPTRTGSTLTTAAVPDVPTTGPPTEGVTAFDRLLPGLLDRWGLPGGTVAVLDGGRLVYARGFGTAGPNTDDPIRPDALIRIGSLSKPLTATATLALVERGGLSLADRVVDLLADLLPDEGFADPQVESITVRQLLRHTAGWDTNTIGVDPVFAPVRVADARGTEPPASAETTVSFLFEQELGFDPGTDFRYSNAGYCMLGRVLEAATGQDYPRVVTDTVLEPLEAAGMSIGATRRANLRADEVSYLSRTTVPSPFRDGERVARPYGAGVLAEALDAPGGWVGSAMDLLRFVRGGDGRSDVPDVIDDESRAAMRARPSVDHWEGARQYYGMGWFVTGDGPLLWHNGSIPGSFGFLAHFTDSDRALVGLFNGRSPDGQLGRFNRDVQQTLLEGFGTVAAWPDRDLFDRYG